MIQWRFPSNDHGENKGINDSGVATFRGTPLKSLAREICQNSLDAAREKTVIVEFNMFSIPTKNVPGNDSLKDAFKRCLDFWGMQRAITTKEFFNKAIETAEKSSCSFLRISDFNTIGLTGTKGEINTNWTNLTKSSGASDKKGTAGGSYGIGKYAPFACSDFSTVFFGPVKTFSFPFRFFRRRMDAFFLILCYTTSIIGLAVLQKRYARPAGRKDGAYEKSLCHHRTGAGHFRHGGRRDCGGFQLSGHETAPCSVI